MECIHWLHVPPSKSHIAKSGVHFTLILIFYLLPVSENRIRDTLEADVKKVTYIPKLQSFEDEINESVGIKEERKPARTYWY